MSGDLHLIKLCVGVKSPNELYDWQQRRLADMLKRGQETQLYHVTLRRPREYETLLDGGSIYWVIDGLIQVRQPLVGFEATVDDAGVAKWKICYSPQFVRVNARPRRPFQGWRYLKKADAPADIICGHDQPRISADLQAMFNHLGLR